MLLAVFHVTDLDGNKLTDEGVISYLEQVINRHLDLTPINFINPVNASVSICVFVTCLPCGVVLQSLATIHCGKPVASNDLTALELTGTDRVGLLSEVFAVLAELQCDVVEAKVWTHNGRIASLIYVKDCNSGSPIKDSQKIDIIVGRLRNVLKGDDDILYAKTSVSMTVTHTERRLHQMMFADRDYERKPVLQHCEDSPIVTVQNLVERGYSVVNVQCKDRMKLLFDVVCTMTDMDYVVFHGTVATSRQRAYLV